MKEIGGFFELETQRRGAYHQGGLALNSARNGLRYIVRAHGISRIYVPNYTCPVVWEALRAEGCELVFYDVDEELLPKDPLPEDAWVLYTDYFGVSGEQTARMGARYPRLILDLAQSFYTAPGGHECVYSPRKFFGIPDGGIVFCSKKADIQMERDISLGRTSHLLRRIELGAEAAYDDFHREDGDLEGAPIKAMSVLTERLMAGIDYEGAARIRRENFRYLHERLRTDNMLPFHISAEDVPMVYPFLPRTGGAALKKRLIENRVYVATYWPGQRDQGFGRLLQSELLALPVDQRYCPEDMDHILEVLHG